MTWIFAAIACCSVICSITNRAAYRNGVADGYGFSREPHNPGYQDAKNILIEGSSHRWPDIEAFSVSPFSLQQVKDGFATSKNGD